MQHHSILPQEIFVSFWRNRNLINAMVRREVLGRYRGSIMGILWSFFNPIFMLAIYTFVFSTVLKTSWIAGSDSKTEFALVLFAGLIVFSLFAECINRAPGLILSNANYVKKVVFPLEILPWVSIGSSLFHCLISFSVWIVFYTIFFGTPHATSLLMPIIIFPLVLIVMGISWALASFGVFLRDVSQFVGVITTALMFLSPVFYSASALPPGYRPFLFMNPLTMVIEQSRDALFWGKAPNMEQYALYLLVAVIVAWSGFAWFQRTRKGFADVL